MAQAPNESTRRGSGVSWKAFQHIRGQFERALRGPPASQMRFCVTVPPERDSVRPPAVGRRGQPGQSPESRTPGTVTSPGALNAPSSPPQDARPRRVEEVVHTVTKQVQQLDRVIIRFAGDSGDGMQLTGDRFTPETAAFGNDLSTLPNFPAEIRAPAGHPARRVQLPAALRRPRHPHARRRARRAGRDEPGRAEGQPRRPAARRRHHRQHRRVHQAQPGQGRLRDQPARGRLAGRLPAARDPDHLADRQGAGEASASPRRTPSAPRTCSPSACCPGCTTGPPRAR